MTDDQPNLVLEQLRLIREEQALTSRKIGAIAETMVSMRKQLDHMSHSIDGLRTDIQTVALAVDEHTTRLDRIDETRPIPNA